MVAKLQTLAYLGLDVFPIEVEVDVARGLPAINIVGLADTAVKESRDRVKAAIKNSGFNFPHQRITVNLAPADVKKEGPHFDLAIALGILQAFYKFNPSHRIKDFVFFGELSLEGKLRPVKGVFPMSLAAKKRRKKIILPAGNAKEAALAQGGEIYPVHTLAEAVSFLKGECEIKPYALEGEEDPFSQVPAYSVDFSEVKGQALAKRALEIAAAGMHNVIMVGPPGVGKTMLAKRLVTILPDLAQEEALQITKIYSISGLLNSNNPIVNTRPFRSPHHSCSVAALVGGGSIPSPGEVTLAHRGVLFLDELPEFGRASLEALRQPLEDGSIHISRARKHSRFPADFLLVATMNPCPCGYFSTQQEGKACHCSPQQIRRYRNKISGPLLDRIDIQLELHNISTKKIFSSQEEETSKDIKQRVEKARLRQKKRFEKEGIFFNSQMGHKQIKKYCVLGKKEQDFLSSAIEELRLSVRAYDKILKVSRTIADLAQNSEINQGHIAEALQYRSLDKELWI